MHWNTSKYIQQEFQSQLLRDISKVSRNKSFDTEQGLEYCIVFLKLERIVFCFKNTQIVNTGITCPKNSQ